MQVLPRREAAPGAICTLLWFGVRSVMAIIVHGYDEQGTRACVKREKRLTQEYYYDVTLATHTNDVIVIMSVTITLKKTEYERESTICTKHSCDVSEWIGD